MAGSNMGRGSLLPVRPDIKRVIRGMGGCGRLVLAEEEERKVDFRGVNRSTSTSTEKKRGSRVVKGVKERTKRTGGLSWCGPPKLVLTALCSGRLLFRKR